MIIYEGTSNFVIGAFLKCFSIVSTENTDCLTTCATFH